MLTPFEKLNNPDPAGSTSLSAAEQLQLLKTLGRKSSPELFGENGSPIKSLGFYEIPPHARYVIAKIISVIDSKIFWNRARDGVTEFRNKMGDLPLLPANAYHEYTVLRVTAPVLKDATGKPRTYGAGSGGYMGLNQFHSGAQRIVHDRPGSRYYYTPTHYTGTTEGTTYFNPFFLVTDIPAGHLSGTEYKTLHAPGF